MSIPTNGVRESDHAPDAPAFMSPTRPLYWSVRRELWENRSIYIAPLIVMAVVLFATLISTIGLPHKMRGLPALEPAKRHAAVVSHFSMAPAPIMLATFLVGFFYCLDALHGERRDRSILFWKSLPVSDRTAVLSKASVPLVILPLIAFVLSAVTLLVMLMASTAILLLSRTSPVTLWAELRFFQEPVIMLYGLTVHALWFAPIYCWLLLVSAWARRATFLWALLPWLATAALEKIAFSTTYFGSMLRYRVMGGMTEAFANQQRGSGEILDQLSQLSPARFLGAPGLWVGLIFAAACLAVAVRLRHDREPI
jgi:ABC-2 type transport system permease protein